MARLWKRADFKPNGSQREAILHTEGPLFLPAGPCSGKTRFLLWRAINLIVNHHVAPQGIYLATFTEKAALQLRDGLRAMLGAATAVTNKPYDISKMYVGTVHSLCQRMIRDRRFQTGGIRAQAPVIMDELAQYLLIRRLSNWKSLLEAGGLEQGGNKGINEILEARGNSRHTAISSLISFFNRMSEEVVDPDAALKQTSSANIKKLLRMYRAYLDLRRNNSGPELTNLSLLQQQAVRVVKQHEHASQSAWLGIYARGWAWGWLGLGLVLERNFECSDAVKNTSQAVPELQEHCAAVSKIFAERYFYEEGDFLRDGERYNHQNAADWLELAAGVCKVEFLTARFDDMLMYCGTAMDYEGARSELLSRIVTQLTIFQFAWGAFETVAKIADPPSIPVKDRQST